MRPSSRTPCCWRSLSSCHRRASWLADMGGLLAHPRTIKDIIAARPADRTLIEYHTTSASRHKQKPPPGPFLAQGGIRERRDGVRVLARASGLGFLPQLAKGFLKLPKLLSLLLPLPKLPSRGVNLALSAQPRLAGPRAQHARSVSEPDTDSFILFRLSAIILHINRLFKDLHAFRIVGSEFQMSRRQKQILFNNSPVARVTLAC